VKRLLTIAGIVVVALAACVVLITVITSRDPSQVDATSGPGALEPDRGSGIQKGPSTPASPANRPPTSGKHGSAEIIRDKTEFSDDEILEALTLGDVVITYDSAKAPAALIALQRDVTGSAFDAFLAGAGQEVILVRRPGAGVQALAWRRRLIASGPDDPKLRDFADAWLGQGPGEG
jgi:hypothetical protein